MGVTFTYVQERGPALWHGSTHSHYKCAAKCEDWLTYGGEFGSGICDHTVAEEEACGCRALEMHLSNSNAATVLKALGYSLEPDYVGHAPAMEVMRKCGEHVGDPLLHRYMEALARLADWAHRQGHMVGWS